MDTKAVGWLPFSVYPKEGDKLIISPVYVFPVEVLERGIIVRTSYKHETVIVNGVSGKATLVEEREIVPAREFDTEPFECRCLDLKVKPYAAEQIAKYGAVPESCRNWRMVIRHRNVAVMSERAQLLNHVYAVGGSTVTDTFTGETMASASLIDILFRPDPK